MPDGWQELVLSDWLRVRGGRWASLDCGLSVPRQNGKNAVLEVYELCLTVGLGRRVLHTAHEVKTARQHFRSVVSSISSARRQPTHLPGSRS